MKSKLFQSITRQLDFGEVFCIGLHFPSIWFELSEISPACKNLALMQTNIQN
jgi:hypothetical protein